MSEHLVTDLFRGILELVSVRYIDSEFSDMSPRHSIFTSIFSE